MQISTDHICTNNICLGVGGRVFMSSMADATTKCACQPAPPAYKQAPGVCEKTFSASFVPQPAENTTSHTPLGAAAAIRRNYTTIESSLFFHYSA